MSAAIRDALLPILAQTIRPPTSGELDHVLIFQPDHLGDIILSEPAVRLLREQLPAARLTGVVGPWSARIARLAWPVDEVIEVDFPGFRRSTARENPIQPYRQLADDAARLRRLEGGRAIVLRDDAWWAAALARASVSGDVIAADDPRNIPFATSVTDVSHLTHRTSRAIAIARSLLELSGAQMSEIADWDMSPAMRATPDQIDAARKLLPGLAEDIHYVVLHPGAGAPVKTWPSRKWRAVISYFTDLPFVLTGTADEAEECRMVADDLENAINIAGETTLDSLIGVLAGANLAVGTDNGPMHLAAALGTRTVRLYGPSNPRKYGPSPGDARHRVVSAGWSCPRCEDLSLGRESGCACMTAIGIDDVVTAVTDGLKHGV